MMHPLGLPFALFSVATAQLLLSKSDQAIVPDSVPPMPPNSPFLNAITSDIDSNPYDFRNVNPADLNLVTSNPMVSTDQLPPEPSPFTSNDLFSNNQIAQAPANDVGTESSMQPETLKVNLLTGPDQYDSSCNSVSTTTGMKVRRDIICPSPGQSRIERLGRWIKGGLDGITNHLLEGEPSEEDRNQDTTEGKNPKGTLSEEERNNKKIYQEDEDVLEKLLGEDDDGFYWKSHDAASLQACESVNPNRPELLCCMGPPASTASGVQKRIPGVDMKNCVPFLSDRPFCTKLNPPGHFCCAKLDHRVITQWGWLGRNCVLVKL